jgi:hypothetical protein
VRVYIAGPMRGYERFNFPAFDAAGALLRRLGHEPVSPADMDRARGFDEGCEGPLPAPFIAEALKRDFAAILTCDAIAFLPGWEKSAGAVAERQVGEAIGLPCYRVDASSFYRERTIGLAGYARAGKDTVAQLVVDHGFEKCAFADPLRPMLYALNPVVPLPLSEQGGDTVHARLSEVVDAYGWDDAKGIAEVRCLLQRLGTEAARAILGPDVWVDALLRRPSSGRIVISDVRFPNEATAVRSRGGVLARVVRPSQRPVNAHRSETALDDWDFDFTITNDGSVADLKPQVDALVAMVAQ